MTASSWAVRDSGFSEATIFFLFSVMEIVATVSQLSPWPENIKDSEFTEITISIKLMKMSS